MTPCNERRHLRLVATPCNDYRAGMRTLLLLSAALSAAACTSGRTDTPMVGGSTTSPLPADAFFARLHTLCGHAYAGRLGAHDASDLAAFAGTPVMHVRECSADEIRIPFHVGTNRSRTWVITRTATGLRLKHEHRHEDGSSDAIDLYGGDSFGARAGSARRQEFPADAESKAMFAAAGMDASIDNVWAISIDPGRRFVYELRRPNRHFSVEFDLGEPVAAPPAPWGAARRTAR
jgi:hypothetical protein